MPHLNRAVNDPLIACNEYKAYPYLVPVNRKNSPNAAPRAIRPSWPDVNDDLRQFLVDNLPTIQPLIDKARADNA